MEDAMIPRNIAAIIAVIATASLALAHGPKVGAKGGVQADAGSFHVEIVPEGTRVHVFLRDQSDKEVPTEGYKGTAVFVIDGKPQRIPLTPAGGNKLTGTSAAPVRGAPKGAVQITTPTGTTVQAKFD
jgi:hypothetical protein